MPQNINSTALAFNRVWRHVDARDQTLGRLASSIATTLMGKYKPTFDPAVDAGDHVVVVNAKHVMVTGRKAEQKKYWSHSQYPGGLKLTPYSHMMEYTPTRIIEKAVSGMLPKNKLRKHRLKRLHVFAEGEHPYDSNLLRDFEADLNDSSNPAARVDHVGVVLEAVKELQQRRATRTGGATP